MTTPPTAQSIAVAAQDGQGEENRSTSGYMCAECCGTHVHLTTLLLHSRALGRGTYRSCVETEPVQRQYCIAMHCAVKYCIVVYWI